jgi:dTDP-glucose 4,6-dehydratase
MDICDFDAFYQLMQDEHIDGIIHLAAESHVDRSIKDPFTFARTNVLGTLSLLQAAKLYWESLPEKYEGKRFYHISTDEVYGALQMNHPEGVKPPFTTWPTAMSSSTRPPSTTPTPRIRLRRHPATTSSAPFTTLTACRPS